MNKWKLEITLIKLWLLCGGLCVLSVLEEVPNGMLFKSSLYLNLIIFFPHSIFKFYLLVFPHPQLYPYHLFSSPSHTLRVLETFNSLIPFQTAQMELLFSLFVDNSLFGMFSIFSDSLLIE